MQMRKDATLQSIIREVRGLDEKARTRGITPEETAISCCFKIYNILQNVVEVDDIVKNIITQELEVISEILKEANTELNSVENPQKFEFTELTDIEVNSIIIHASKNHLTGTQLWARNAGFRIATNYYKDQQ